MSRKGAFPFSAIVGQDEMKQALLIAAVEPSIGGVLVFGDRGTGKSTAIRGLAALLPPMAAFEGCAYHCDPHDLDGYRCGACQDRADQNDLASTTVSIPVVDLPLGATEDRVVGALDLERALSMGEKAFEPGLLARAHRGFLYIDEVNLLEDHLVDLLLDVAASGENVVEREGLSIRHPARFVLVGSGNPEEGELRPQLLDRFGFSVEVTTPDDLETRVEVIRRRDAFERDPTAAWCPRATVRAACPCLRSKRLHVEFFAWRARNTGMVEKLMRDTGSKISPDQLERYAILARHAGHIEAAIGMMANWDLKSLEPDLVKLEPDILLITGADDRMISPTQSLRLRRILPAARLEVLPDLGHLAHEGAPEQVTQLILKAYLE